MFGGFNGGGTLEETGPHPLTPSPIREGEHVGGNGRLLGLRCFKDATTSRDHRQDSPSRVGKGLGVRSGFVTAMP